MSKREYNQRDAHFT